MARHHRSFNGGWVTITLKNGKVITDKFVQAGNGRKTITLREYGRLQTSEIEKFWPGKRSTYRLVD